MTKDAQKEFKKEVEKLESIKFNDSKEVVKRKLDEEAKVLNRIYTSDAFQNQMARLGFGQPNLVEGADYPLTRESYNYNLFTSLYRSNWIARKIIDTYPSDMLRNWIKFNSEVEPSSLRKVNAVIRKTKTIEKLKEGLKWSRLYGGAAALILIDGDEDLSEPLDYDTIDIDSYKGLLVFDRWSGVNPCSELIDDITDIEYGLPKYYEINLTADKNKVRFNIDNASTIKVHHSRMLIFRGRDLPLWEKQTETYWGESELEIVLSELKKRDNTSYNIASLTFLANIRVLKMSDLGQLLGGQSQQARQNLYNVLNAQNQLMSNMGIYVMDKDDDFSAESYSFSGLSEIYESFMLDIAGACEMPVTKLFGRNPAGFNATGESDLTQYADTIAEKQITYLQGILDKLLPIIFISTIGEVPEDLDYDFNPYLSMSNKDLADLSQSILTPIVDAFNAGLISKSIALKEMKQQSDKTGMWSNITDDIIEAAEKEEKQLDITPEEQDNIYSEVMNESDLNRGERNDSNNINNYNNENNISDVKPDSQNIVHDWRKRIADLFRGKI